MVFIHQSAVLEGIRINRLYTFKAMSWSRGRLKEVDIRPDNYEYSNYEDEVSTQIVKMLVLAYPR